MYTYLDLYTCTCVYVRTYVICVQSHFLYIYVNVCDYECVCVRLLGVFLI